MVRVRIVWLAMAGAVLNFTAAGMALAQVAAPATAAEDPAMAMIRTVLEAVVTVLIAWAAKKFSDKTGIDIEATHRDALHSAAMTGINAALAKAKPIDVGNITKGSPIFQDALNWVTRSVPDALKHLGVDINTAEGREKLSQLIESKLGALINAPATTAAVPVAALRQAGRASG